MKDEIVKALLQSVHADGDRLPSVRDLMKSLDAASATVQRALHELSKHQFIYTVPGKGCFWGTPPQKTIPLPRALQDSLSEEFQADLRAGVFSFQEQLPSQKELATRYRVSTFRIRQFLLKKLSEGMLIREGKGRYFFPKQAERFSESEILLITRCSSWGEFSPASEREMDFIKSAYQTGAKKRFKLKLLGFDEHSERFIDRNGNGKQLGDYPDAIGILLSTMLMENPQRVLSRFKSISIPLSIWWEHPQGALSRVFLGKENWAFFNSTFGKNPGIFMGRHLLKKGFQKAAYISPYHASSWSKDRLQGLKESGLEIHPFTDGKWASPWDFRNVASKNGPKFSIELRARLYEKEILKTLVQDIGDASVWIPANDEIAGLLRELEEENVIGKIPYMVAFDNSIESYLLRLDSFDFNTEILVEQMFYHLELGKNDPFQGNGFREISGKVVEK